MISFQKGLTIIIPTYNRKERLLHQLSTLFCQIDTLQDVGIIVADNHSDYDVEEELRNSLNPDHFSRLEIISRPYNMGMSLGISMPISYCKTQWLWILSDDDEVVGDISIVKKDIVTYQDCALLKYSNITDQPQEEAELVGIYDFLNYYESPKHTAGDLLFLSNSIFNMEKLYPYNSNAFIWTCTLYGHIMPLLFGLTTDPNGIKCKMRNYGLVSYLKPDIPVTSQKILRYTLGFSMIDDIVFPGEENDKKLHRRICRIIQHGMGFFNIASTIISSKSKREARNAFYRIYYVFFDYGIKNRCIHLLFVLSQLLHFNLFRIIKKG